MTWQTFWLFVTVTFLVSATPGPNMLLVMSSSARFGFRAARATMAGCLTALLAMMTISAAGLGALLQAFPSVFDALRWLGAAYLLYLGIRTWRAPVAAAAEEAGTLAANDASGIAAREAAPAAAPRGITLFRQGLMVAASNPKAILFAAAFLPQFIQPAQPQLPQFVILLLTFAVIEVSWYLIYASSGRQLARYLRRATVLRTFNRLSGGIFMGFAAILAAVRE
jgi:threonine/homoserine/homoserine lactone efflux protein